VLSGVSIAVATASCGPRVSFHHVAATDTTNDSGLGKTRERVPEAVRGERDVVSVILELYDAICEPTSMSFIVLRRPRNTKSFYLVESYRDERPSARCQGPCNWPRFFGSP
jgi:hypothetical protein